MAPSEFWDFPPQGPANNEGMCGVASDFGPVHLNDVILLQWTTDGDPFNIKLECCGNEGTVKMNATSTPWPVEFASDLIPDLNSTNETWGCHFWNGRKTGSGDDTVVFPYINLEGDTVVTWKASASSTATSPNTSAPPSTPTAVDGTTSSSTASSTASQASGQASPTGLSHAAVGGICAGVGIIVLLVIGSLTYKYRRIAKPRARRTRGMDVLPSIDPDDSNPDSRSLRPRLADIQHFQSSASGSARLHAGHVSGNVTHNTSFVNLAMTVLSSKDEARIHDLGDISGAGRVPAT